MRLPTLIIIGLCAASASAIQVTRTPIERDVWRRKFTIESSANREGLARTYLNKRGVRIGPGRSPWDTLREPERHLLVVREAIERDVDALVAGAWREDAPHGKLSAHATEHLAWLLGALFGGESDAQNLRWAFGKRLNELAAGATPRVRGIELDVHVDRLADALTRLITRAIKAASAGDYERVRATTARAIKVITEVYVIESRLERGPAALKPIRAAFTRWRRGGDAGVVDRFWAQVRLQSLDHPRGVVSIMDFDPDDGADEISTGIVAELAILNGRPDVIEACEHLLATNPYRGN